MRKALPRLRLIIITPLTLAGFVSAAHPQSAFKSLAPTNGSPAEHMVMGNPSNAVTDVNTPLNYLISRDQYVLSYNRDRGVPNWVAWHLDPSWIGTTPATGAIIAPTRAFRPGWYQVLATDYSGSGFDRGRHAPSGDRTSTVADNSATFFMTNMMPQSPDNNQGPWEKFETYCRTAVGQGNGVYHRRQRRSGRNRIERGHHEHGRWWTRGCSVLHVEGRSDFAPWHR